MQTPCTTLIQRSAANREVPVTQKPNRPPTPLGLESLTMVVFAAGKRPLPGRVQRRDVPGFYRLVRAAADKTLAIGADIHAGDRS